nr:LysR family transcriptional regulator [Paenibacillus zanthoxyli]
MSLFLVEGNIEWYKVFYMVARYGNLSRAAEKLFITQPAVTHTIKQLEAHLGNQLLFRTSRGVKLTENGEILYQHIEKAFQHLMTAERMLVEIHQLQQGEITIGAGDTLCKHYLLPYLKMFHETYPDIKIQVTNRTTQETIRLLKDGVIDFGIINLPVQDSQVAIRQSLSLQDCFIASRKFSELAEGYITPAILVNYPLILLESGSSIRQHINWYFRSHGLEIAPEIELGSVDLLADFARAGLGIACIIHNFTEPFSLQGDLFEIRLTPPIPTRNIGVVTLKSVPLSSAARKFIDMLP